jgi:hypothetical protein
METKRIKSEKETSAIDNLDDAVMTSLKTP